MTNSVQEARSTGSTRLASARGRKELRIRGDDCVASVMTRSTLRSNIGQSRPLDELPNKALHADGARLGETTLVFTLGDRRLGAGAAGERQGVRQTEVATCGCYCDPTEGRGAAEARSAATVTRYEATKLLVDRAVAGNVR